MLFRSGGEVHFGVGAVGKAVHKAGLGGGGNLQQEGQGAGGADALGKGGVIQKNTSKIRSCGERIRCLAGIHPPSML